MKEVGMDNSDPRFVEFVRENANTPPAEYIAKLEAQAFSWRSANVTKPQPTTASVAQTAQGKKASVDLVEKGGAFQIQTSEDMGNIIERLLPGTEAYRETSAICSSYVLDHSGATERIMNYVKSILKD